MPGQLLASSSFIWLHQISGNSVNMHLLYETAWLVCFKKFYYCDKFWLDRMRTNRGGFHWRLMLFFPACPFKFSLIWLLTTQHANKKQTNKKQIMWVDGLQSNCLYLALITSTRRLYRSSPAAPVRSRSNSINGFGVSVGRVPDPCRDTPLFLQSCTQTQCESGSRPRCELYTERTNPGS